MSEQEIDPRVAEAVRNYFENLFSGLCPHCHAKVEKQEQIGRCVYAHPCGHRMYQGEAGAFKKEIGE